LTIACTWKRQRTSIQPKKAEKASAFFTKRMGSRWLSNNPTAGHHPISSSNAALKKRRHCTGDARKQAAKPCSRRPPVKYSKLLQKRRVRWIERLCCWLIARNASITLHRCYV